MSEVDDRAKAALDAPMSPDRNEAGAATVREFLGGLLTEVWTDPPKRVWGTSDWSDPLEVALIEAGLVGGELDDEGCIISIEQGELQPLVRDMINALVESPKPFDPPPLDYQVDVLSSLLAHLRMRLEWIERGANYDFGDVNARFSPGQVWARLLRNTAEERLLWIEGVIGQAESAGRCWMTQHDRTIEQQHERIVKLEQRITDLGGDLP